jgi:hypothetical protein
VLHSADRRAPDQSTFSVRTLFFQKKRTIEKLWRRKCVRCRSRSRDCYGVPRKTATETKNLFYGFSINGDEIFCREAYESAEGVLAHLENVGTLLAEMLTMADLIHVELHGPAEELQKLKGPLAHLNPAWFTLEASLPH